MLTDFVTTSYSRELAADGRDQILKYAERPEVAKHLGDAYLGAVHEHAPDEAHKSIAEIVRSAARTMSNPELSSLVQYSGLDVLASATPPTVALALASIGASLTGGVLRPCDAEAAEKDRADCAIAANTLLYGITRSQAPDAVGAIALGAGAAHNNLSSETQVKVQEVAFNMIQDQLNFDRLTPVQAYGALGARASSIGSEQERYLMGRWMLDRVGMVPGATPRQQEAARLAYDQADAEVSQQTLGVLRNAFVEML